MRALILILLVATGCAATRPGGGLVILITDFGAEGSYVGALKGAIYRQCPGARIDDLTHEIPPFDIEEGARVLREAAPEYPPGTVFVAVVDPGVGTERRAIAVRSSDGSYFIGPDNGLLAPALETLGIEEVREIDPSKWGRTGRRLSSTFHGRDVFGPAAGRLACGSGLTSIGSPGGEIVTLELTSAVIDSGMIRGRVAAIDHYGNALTDIPARLLLEAGRAVGETLRIRIGDREIQCPWVRTYGDVPRGGLLCLENSQGLLEIAENQGSLAQRIGAKRGTAVEVMRE